MPSYKVRLLKQLS